MRFHLAIVAALALLLPATMHAQAIDLQNAAPPLPNGQTQEQRGRQLLDQMIAALGGPAWLSRNTANELGRTAAFFRGAPNGQTIDFHEARQFQTATQPALERIGFLSDKSMILPGKKIDVVQIWTADGGSEITYKGKSVLPKDQVEDYMRRRAHSIEAVIFTWMKAPGVIVIAEGTSMVERHLADKLTVLSANNDAVTLELDVTTHLPLARTFQWRNQQFQDHDEDREEYDDYHEFSGLQTPLTLSRYRNGDLVNQRFLSKVEYNVPLPPDTFNPDVILKKK